MSRSPNNPPPLAKSTKKLGGFRGRAGTDEDCARARAVRAKKAAYHSAAIEPLINRIDPDSSMSLRKIAALLTAEGVPTPAERRVWTAATVARVKAKFATTA